jgi:hypothetical protein
MDGQLTLLPAHDDEWRLDDATKETGRRGIAEARRILAEARQRAAA